MQTSEVSRKQRFRAALAYAGKTQQEFAAEQGVTPGHLSAVLAEKRESGSLTAAIEAFIVAHTPDSAA
jgi:transcriptional regulator with XRE-family HTH domain